MVGRDAQALEPAVRAKVIELLEQARKFGATEEELQEVRISEP